MTSRHRMVPLNSAASGDKAGRALKELDDEVFSDVVLREVHRRSAFHKVAGQIDGAMNTVRAQAGGPARGAAGSGAGAVPDSRRPGAARASVSRGAVMQVPHVCCIEAGEILARRGMLAGSDPSSALRKFARDGRLIVLRGDRRWVYPTFQLGHVDPRDPNNIVCAVNRMLDAGRDPEAATWWWTSPSASLSGRRAPVELLGEDHDTLRQLAAAYAAGPDL